MVEFDPAFNSHASGSHRFEPAASGLDFFAPAISFPAFLPLLKNFLKKVALCSVLSVISPNIGSGPSDAKSRIPLLLLNKI